MYEQFSQLADIINANVTITWTPAGIDEYQMGCREYHKHDIPNVNYYHYVNYLRCVFICIIYLDKLI